MSLPPFKLLVEPAQLAPLAPRLRELGYTEEAVRKHLRIYDNGEMVGEQLHYYQWLCDTQPCTLSTLIQFFLLGGGADLETLDSLFDRELLKALAKCNAVVGFNGIYSCQVVLYPCGEAYFFTDYWYYDGHQPEGKIYEIGTDSYVLARTTPRSGQEKALDLCTGSGIHAVLSSLAGCSSKAVDINPRALEYTKANAALNGVECQTFNGDLFSVLEPEERFDLITANPPFVPSPDPDIVLIHRSPGETGEEVSERMVGALEERLAVGGLFSMILEYPVIESELYVDRLERWLGSDGTGWGIGVFWYLEKTIGEYVVQHMGPVQNKRETFDKYLQSYLRHGIVSIRFANVFIQRLNPGTPNWKVMERVAEWPRRDVREDVRFWLECQTRYNDPAWSPDTEWKPRLSPLYNSLWRDWDDARGLLEVAPHNWIPSAFIDAHCTELLMRIKNGDKTIAELRSDWFEDGESEADFQQALRTAGKLRALV